MHPDYSSRSPGGDTLGRSLQPPSPADDNQEDADSGASDCLVPTAGGISPAARKRPLEPSAVAEAAAASRKPQKDKHCKDDDDGRQIRRERNKIAAAKCRNRRRQLTDALQAETDQLEDEKSSLRSEIDELLKEKERLERVLSSCKMEEEEERDVAMASPESDNEDPRVPAAAICGNSNVLLRSRGDDDETPADPEDDPVPETPFVPDVGDLSEPLRLPDRETSRRSVADDLPCLSAPPGGDFRTRAVFSFGLDDADGGGPEDGLDSPTLLTL